MKTAHESPLSVFSKVQSLTDYDYFLVHLFEESEEYFHEALRSVDSGRETILDNSVFELNTAFNSKKFAGWVEEMKPTWYIIPDALEEKEKTVDQYFDFIDTYDLPGKKIGVVQGKSYEEVVECYQAIEYACDKVAISFDYSFFEEWFPSEKTKFHKWVKGRQLLILKMLNDDVINQDKPHHLLGCGLPQEFKAYQKYKWIDSLDTSNPVVAGIKGMKYSEDGLEDKPSQKLFTMLNHQVSDDEWSLIEHNITMFRGFCK